MLAADGRVVWLRDICSVVLRGQKRVSLRGAMLDVTERRRTDAALRVVGERLRTVIESAPVIFFSIDGNGMVKLCEGRGLEAAAVDPAELVGRRVGEWPRRTPASSAT